ncbi:hypothetical protein QTN25_009576 [Entamoeba marina]
MSTPTHTDIRIDRQTAQKVITVGINEIYVVVKQCNFQIVVVSENTSLEHTEVRCELLYDTPDLRKVGYINSRPLKFKVQHTTPKLLNIECKLNVLSSQHEDLLFRIEIAILENKQVVDTLMSSPIRSISKIDSRKQCKFDKIIVDSKRQTPTFDETITISPQAKQPFQISLLNTNTTFLEQLKIQLQKNDQIVSIEGCFRKYIEMLISIDYQYHQQLINDSLQTLSNDQLYGLDEISEIFVNSINNPHPFYPTQMNGRQFNRYGYVEDVTNFSRKESGSFQYQ